MVLEQTLLRYNFPAGSISLFQVVSLGNGERNTPLFEEGYIDLNEAMGIKPSISTEFEKRLGLIFEGKDSPNLCLANHEDVRPEFRTSFTEKEILEYLYSRFPKMDVIREPVEITIAYPADADEFWEGVEKGRKKIAKYFSNAEKKDQ